MKTKLLLLATNLFTLNINCEIPTYTSLKDVIQRCQELPGQTYTQSCGAWYEKFRDQMNLRDYTGTLPITDTAYATPNPKAAVSLLIKYGANLELTDTYGLAALRAAILQAKPKIVKKIIAAGANLEQSNKLQETPIYTVINQINRTTSDLEWLKTNDQYNRLFPAEQAKRIAQLRAKQANNIEVLKNITRANANLNTTNRSGNTPLHLVTLSSKPNIPALKELVVAQADINAINNCPDNLDAYTAISQDNGERKSLDWQKNYLYNTPLDNIYSQASVCKTLSPEAYEASQILTKHGGKITDRNSWRCRLFGQNYCKLITPKTN